MFFCTNCMLFTRLSQRLGQHLRSRSMAAEARSSRAVVVLHHDACELHNIPDHPEQPARVPEILSVLHELEGVQFVNDVPEATKEQLERFHTRKHVKHIFETLEMVEARAEGLKSKGGRSGHMRPVLLPVDDGDTNVCSGSREAALRAAGAAVKAVSLVMENKASSCFCAVRPPGHHAEPGEAMGFCLFNNVGVAIHHARSVYGVKRVAVLDWDVHHGNGTQKGFWSDRHTLVASSHQMPCYPGTGHPKEKGAHGNIVNQALAPGSSSKRFRQVWSDVILPRVAAFKPELIMVSAGFDAHEDDPLAEVQLADNDYEWIQSEIMKLSEQHCAGRVVSVLEGGYDLKAIARCAKLCVQAQVSSAERLHPQADEDEDDTLVNQLHAVSVTDVPTFTDARLLAEFDRCHREGVLRSNPREGQQRRWVEGKHHFCVSFDAEHFAKKREHGLPPRVDMSAPCDPSKFNFTQVQSAEKLCRFVTPHDEQTHTILANISPLMHGHCVLPVYCEQLRPQRLTLAAVESAAHLLSQSTDSGHFRLVFNSLAAFASVNHLHLHLMYVDALGGNGHSLIGFPIESAEVSPLTSSTDCTVFRVHWCVPCILFEGTQESISEHIQAFIDHLHSLEIPYNCLFARHADRVKVWVIPRKPQHEFDPKMHGFNAAICEIAGFIVANNQETFDQSTDDSIAESLASGAALDNSSFSDLEGWLIKKQGDSVPSTKN